MTIQRKKKFIDELREVVISLKRMKPNDVHIIHVRASYGNYQLVIGPTGPGRKKELRPIEINGNLHHLFISPEKVTANPTHRQVENYMRDTVIMRDVTIHILDSAGEGKEISASRGHLSPVLAKEYINLAGPDGDSMLKIKEMNGELTKAAYHIIQSDILHTLRTHPQGVEEESVTSS